MSSPNWLLYAGSATGGGGSGSSGLLSEIAIPHGTVTNVVSPSTPTLGQRLEIVLEIDSTGGGTITWDATLLGTSVNDIDNAANAKNFYEFIGLADGKWHLMNKNLGGA